MAQQHNDLAYLVNYLQDERGIGEGRLEPVEDDAWLEGAWEQFRALVNTREPLPAPSKFLRVQDRLLRGMIEQRGITDVADAPPCPFDEQMSLWRGDITTLRADAIVNAANSALLGCWVPGHFCIDNAIHTFAGVQLRLECAQIMRAQGIEEPVGRAKVTAAYNLPARHVIHTVGPIAQGPVTARQREQLARCYTACLDAAAARGLESIAFCCISTGVFGFPRDEGAKVAVGTVRAWLRDRAKRGDAGTLRVVFDVFDEVDEQIYQGLLGW